MYKLIKVSLQRYGELVQGMLKHSWQL